MKYIAAYEPDMKACGVLDLQLLSRYLQSTVPMDELLEGTGIDAGCIHSPDTHITLMQKLAVFNNALSKTDEPGLGLKVGQQARFSDFGVLGYAVFSSNTLLDALMMGFKYLRLAGPVLRKSMKVDGNEGYFRADQLVELDSLLPFCCEYWFAAVLKLCEEVIQQPFPSTVIYFPYPKPDYAALYEETFQCEVVFDSERLEWQFNAEKLYESLPTANAMTLTQCLKSCDEMLAKVNGALTLNEKITQMLLERPGQYPSIEVLSSELGMSSRTLRRHLKTENTSYQHILDHVRYSLARHYLLSTHISIEEVSERVGYSDSANFRQAFRKWSGHSPRAYRTQHLA
ncbi:AraC family transcriptional regulator [Enterovibrio norvegicus]|uniref:AraC family transcriptional regulator n=1 Tax=Enterovibrio norvegicus TaxID=188144 RepID=A0A2N7L7D1_9GAMM|nr:AraC family transcriptional regulator [Enterovibrio norvegicus]PMN89884.1 AraC family transcriptional regulator [Enterovibrio norvegicus]